MFAKREIEVDEIYDGSRRTIDEIAVEIEITDERVDLALRQRHRPSAFEVTAEKAIGWQGEVERGVPGIFNDGWPVFLRERESAEDASDTARAFVAANAFGDGLTDPRGAPRRRTVMRVSARRASQRSADATRERDDAVMREHVAIERIDRGIANVGREQPLDYTSSGAGSRPSR